ncbi:MAG: hypothetical protein JWQ66_3528 [Mucilaginibacter sp.]|nr:hypothetical protein [Mucilaginibacter sp.]
MHRKNIFLFAVVFVFAISACKKSGTNPGLSLTPPHTGSDVYVAGFITAKNGHPVAAYWKNGVITKLGDSTLVSEASSIIVQGSDIYVAGISSSINQANTTVTYWKNGVAVRMPLIADLGVSQTAFAINGNDLYMAGDLTVSNQNTANFWKNNVSTTLPDYSAGSYAYGIYSSGPDLYVTGYANIPGGLSTAVYWKNGVLKKLGDETKYQSMGYSIKVSGSDIYVAGYIEHISNNGNTLQAVYWKNGVQTILTDISLAADVFDIVIKQ